MNLMDRLAQHVKHEVMLQAEGFASEAGMLQKVGKRFIRVSDQYFVPHTLHEIVLLNGPRKQGAASVSLRTTYGGSFSAELVKVGTDFAEVVVSREAARTKQWVLIPLARVISIEETG
ncbi:hypothetical protein E1757_26120 [Paenibacillus piri]|uniref:Uncharacterized protein n=1 Tax=Paenibacillus piri TaxID=2547395 RepID=A0A4R5KI32_9BACL|nr:hypothetical protein E1757_26120 [Paenibacillus piri]